MHAVFLWFVLLWWFKFLEYPYGLLYHTLLILMGAALALGQSQDYRSASEVTLEYKGKLGRCLTKKNASVRELYVYFISCIVCHKVYSVERWVS